LISWHAGWSTSLTMRIPEFIGKALSSLQPYTDQKGTIWPFLATLSPSSLTVANTYSGTAIFTVIPSNGFDQTVNRLITSLVARYRKFEATMAPYMNMVLQSQKYPSLLDLTVIRSGPGNYIGIHGRRRITDDVLTALMVYGPFMSYDVGNGETTNNPNSAAYSTESTQEYLQNNHRELSGYETITTLAAANKYDGLVNGAETQNIPDSANGGQPDSSLPINIPGPSGKYGGSPLAPPRLLMVGEEVPPPVKGYIAKIAARLVPRSGKYCGPGWTAGVDTGDVTPPSVAGRYVVEPVSKEDAICKAHDEAYLRAGDDLTKIGNADAQMIRSLDRLELDDGLSLYARAARIAIMTKHRLNPLGDDYQF